MDNWDIITNPKDSEDLEGRNWDPSCSMALFHKERGVVMSDADFELEDIKEFLSTNPKGHILVAGLGLGIVVDSLLSLNDVEYISVLEIDSEIIDKVGPKYKNNSRVEIIHTNAKIFEISSLKTPPNHIYLDIWDTAHEYQDRLDLLTKYSLNCDNVFVWAMDRSKQLFMENQNSR